MSEYIFVTNIFEYSNIFVTLWCGLELKLSGVVHISETAVTSAVTNAVTGPIGL